MIKQASLAIQNLTVSVADRVVLNELSLTICPGEIHVLMGPNGIGKSSLVKSIAGHGQYPCSKGQLTLNGRDITEFSPDARAREGLFLAFQYPSELEGITIANFLRTAIKAYPDNEAAHFSATQFYECLYGLMDRLGLQRSFTGRALNQGFSGGEKKRLEMLQMLLFKPKYALLDEIDSGLDMDALKMVSESVHSLKQNHQTGFLIITHYNRLVELLNPEKIHLLYNGQIKASGSKELLKKLETRGYEYLLSSQ